MSNIFEEITGRMEREIEDAKKRALDKIKILLPPGREVFGRSHRLSKLPLTVKDSYICGDMILVTVLHEGKEIDVPAESIRTESENLKEAACGGEDQ